MQYDFGTKEASFLDLKAERDALENQNKEGSNTFRDLAYGSQELSNSTTEALRLQQRGGSSVSDNSATQEVTRTETRNDNEASDYSDISAVAAPAPIDVVSEAVKKEAERLSDSEQSNTASNPASKQKKTKHVKQLNDDTSTCQVKGIPVAVMNAIRSAFPHRLSNAEAITAFAYIHTGGGFNLPRHLKDVVANYDGDKSQLDIITLLSNIDKRLHEITTTVLSTEIATSVVLTDRLFGGLTVADTPKVQNLQQKKSVEMLENMREAALNQRNTELDKRARQSYRERTRTSEKNN